MLVTPDAMVAGIAGAQGQRVIIVEDALPRGRGLEIDDADVALAAIDAGGFAHRRARIDAERGGQALGPVVRIGELEIGSASCRERVRQYGSFSVVAGSVKKKTET